MKTVLVTGNCQARPLTTLLERTGMFTCLPPIVLNLAKAKDQDMHQARIAQADIVLVQKTADTFNPPYLRSEHLRATHDCVRVWPNIFYAGQHPFLRYMTHVTQGRLFGPLEAMHDLRIFLRWRQDRGLTDAPAPPEDYPANVASLSWQTLQGREAGCDAIISDFLRAQNLDAPLFLTFNHPTNRVLTEMCRRLLATCGLSIEIPRDPEAPEALGRYVVPSSWTGPDHHFQGDKVEINPQTGIAAGVPGHGPHAYDTATLERQFFEVYEANPVFRDLEQLRFTSAVPDDLKLLGQTGP